MFTQFKKIKYKFYKKRLVLFKIYYYNIKEIKKERLEMRTESISKNSENKKIITEVQKVEKSANTKLKALTNENRRDKMKKS